MRSKETWARHSNPWSGWTRLLTYPLVFVPVWNRSWSQAVPVVLWLRLNPRLFPSPKDRSSWMTRGVLGEQLWTRARPLDFSLLLNAPLALSFALALRMAYSRRFRKLLLFGGIAFALKLWFVNRMTAYYDRHGRVRAAVEEVPNALAHRAQGAPREREEHSGVRSEP